MDLRGFFQSDAQKTAELKAKKAGLPATAGSKGQGAQSKLKLAVTTSNSSAVSIPTSPDSDVGPGRSLADGSERSSRLFSPVSDPAAPTAASAADVAVGGDAAAARGSSSGDDDRDTAPTLSLKPTTSSQSDGSGPCAPLSPAEELQGVCKGHSLTGTDSVPEKINEVELVAKIAAAKIKKKEAKEASEKAAGRGGARAAPELHYQGGAEWVDLVMAAALLAGREKKNIESSYLIDSQVQIQLAALGEANILALLAMCSGGNGGAEEQLNEEDRRRVSSILEAAKLKIDEGRKEYSAGAKAAFNAVLSVYGVPKKPQVREIPSCSRPLSRVAARQYAL